MDKTAIEMTGGGLKCDNPDCDWIDMSIPMKDYKKWINAPCPKCGSNLLTKQDYKMVKVLNGFVRVINFIYFFIPKKWLKKKLEKKYGSFDENDRAHMSVSFDGTGKPHFSDIEKVEK
jgi:hypothetical protein